MTLLSWGTFCRSSLLLSPALGLLLRLGKITSLALYALSLAAFSCSNALGDHELEGPIYTHIGTITLHYGGTLPVVDETSEHASSCRVLCAV